jgi:uncharacterized membrane protein YbhN (UPF0104 family)
LHLGFAAARSDRLLYGVLIGMVIGAAIVGGMVTTQRRGLDVIARLVNRLAPSAGQHAAAVTEAVEAAYRRPLLLCESLTLHVLAWFGAAGGTWLILYLIGRPLPFLSVVAIESLLFAIRNAAFVVPGGLGVQEGAYALLGPLFGLPVEAALALSLLKRSRDIAVGVPMLLSWQLAESRRRLRDA